MGLGKTIQMIALILGTQKEAEDFAKKPTAVSTVKTSISIESSSSSSIQSADENSIEKLKSKGTLIICPLSTVANWEEQLANHVQKGALDVYVYHGGSRISDPSHLINYDIVITTYNVSGTEFSKQSKGQKNQQSKNTVNDNDSINSSTSSALQQIHWFRIILDEAHIIKDVTTVQSQAACSLKAERRWCLTGTPIQNK
jgi:SWI/SNF-related matrix-associated actin-dependent regulator of chromatin subfamily A3